jgi:hypothetical protein
MSDTELLKAVFSTNTRWAELSTIAVFFGLLGDIFVIFAFDMRDKTKSRWEIGLAFAASLIIAVGVFGEWRSGHNASNASSQLQTILEKQTADSNARAKDAEARVAEATLKIEEERTARLTLEAKMADRRLTAEQKRRIHDVLSTQAGYAVIVVSRLTDTEGKTYGSDFIDAFKASGWNAQWDVDWLRDTENVSIATVSGVKGPEVALLDAALTAAHIPHGFTSIEPPDIHSIGGTGFQPGMTYLLVGRHEP